ncbi:MAG: hypothetical protein AB1724_19750 [Thermodesulfobacteriota bacterium]
MKKTLIHFIFVRNVLVTTLLYLLVVSPAAFADIITTSYTNSSGQAESSFLMRCNNNGFAVGLAGNSVFEEYLNFCMSKKQIPPINGLICSDVNSPSTSTTVYAPVQAEVNGVVYSLEKLKSDGWLIDHLFLPFDINDHDTIVGSVIFTTVDPKAPIVSLPFIADKPWNTPKVIFGFNDNGCAQPSMPVSGYKETVSAFATGINNSGDIVGAIIGMGENNNYVSLQQGIVFNQSVVGDGLLSADEFSVFNCGDSVLTCPLSINNAGAISGIVFNFKYCLNEDSLILSLDGNYLLSDDNMTIPAGPSSPSESIQKIKYTEVIGFVKSNGAADNDFVSVDFVDTSTIEGSEQPGIVEVYATIPYTILDSGEVLIAYTNSRPDSSSWITLNQLVAATIDPDQPPIQINSSSFSFRKALLPDYKRAVNQGAGPSNALSYAYGDFNLSKIGVGGYTTDGIMIKPFINNPYVKVK